MATFSGGLRRVRRAPSGEARGSVVAAIDLAKLVLYNWHPPAALSGNRERGLPGSHGQRAAMEANVNTIAEVGPDTL